MRGVVTLVDDDPKVQAGYKWLNLNFLFKPWAWLTIVWHDKITSSGSFATRVCINGKRIAENFGEQLRHISNVPRNGFRKLISRLAGGLMPTIQPPFYEGPETEAERQQCLKDQGRAQDGTLIMLLSEEEEKEFLELLRKTNKFKDHDGTIK